MSTTLPTLLSAGDNIQTLQSNWTFNDSAVAENFNQHVHRSVPYYLETQQLAVELSDWFVQSGGKIYDLGCATGSTIADLAKRHARKSLHFTGIDTSAQMLEKARKGLDGFARINLKQADACELPFEQDLSMVYSLYTLQFIDPQQRLELCKKIYSSLSRRGAFVLVEKVLDFDSMVGDIFVNLHWGKKAAMGFEPSEIYAKAQSLRGVLTPFTVEENLQMLKEAGFERTSVFFKWCNFAGIVAIK